MPEDIGKSMVEHRQRLVFNASFPRAGGTLLQLLLGQNPKIFAPINSPLLELVHALTTLFEGSFFTASDSVSLPALAYRSSIRALLRGFYDFTGHPLVVDKSGTGALLYADLLGAAVDEFRVILCVRDPRSIIATLERDLRHNRLAPHELPPALKDRPLAERVDWWLFKGQLGLALERWKQVLRGGPAASYFVLRYEDLCLAPHATLGLLHDFLSLDPFKYRPDALPAPSPQNCFHQSTQSYGPALREARSEFLELLGTEVSNQIVLSNIPFYSEIYPEIFAMDPKLLSKIPPEQR